MTISAVWVWLIAALVLGGSEILTGTFYLLVLAVSCLAGAVAAGLALGAAWQFSACAVLAVTGCGLCISGGGAVRMRQATGCRIRMSARR